MLVPLRLTSVLDRPVVIVSSDRSVRGTCRSDSSTEASWAWVSARSARALSRSARTVSSVAAESAALTSAAEMPFSVW